MLEHPSLNLKDLLSSLALSYGGQFMFHIGLSMDSVRHYPLIYIVPFDLVDSFNMVSSITYAFE